MSPRPHSPSPSVSSFKECADSSWWQCDLPRSLLLGAGLPSFQHFFFFFLVVFQPTRSDGIRMGVGWKRIEKETQSAVSEECAPGKISLSSFSHSQRSMFWGSSASRASPAACGSVRYWLPSLPNFRTLLVRQAMRIFAWLVVNWNFPRILIRHYLFVSFVSMLFL